MHRIAFMSWKNQQKYNWDKKYLITSYHNPSLIQGDAQQLLPSHTDIAPDMTAW